MKTILPFLFLLSFACGAQVRCDSSAWFGPYNIAIGKFAANAFRGCYSVIIGHDSVAQNIQYGEMLWIVDWDEPALTPDLKEIILEYYNEFVITGNDTKVGRRLLGCQLQRHFSRTEYHTIRKEYDQILNGFLKKTK